MQTDSKTEDIRYLISTEIRIGEIRSHVVESAYEIAAGSGRGIVVLAGNLEIDKLNAAVSAQENISRLDVAMDHSERADVRQPRKSALTYAKSLICIEATREAEKLILKRFAFKILKHNDMDIVERSAFPEASKIPDNIGMIDAKQLIRPLFQPTKKTSARIVYRHDLQRNYGADGDAGKSITFADSLVHRALTSDPRLEVGNSAKASYVQILVQNLTDRVQLPELTFTGVPETRVV